MKRHLENEFRHTRVSPKNKCKERSKTKTGIQNFGVLKRFTPSVCIDPDRSSSLDSFPGRRIFFVYGE